MANDYLIECVTYDKHHQIIRVKCRIIYAGGSESAFIETKTRDEILEDIKNGSDFRTRNKEGGPWEDGARVKHFNLNGITYITTEGNETKEDNLGELDECAD